MTDQFLLVHSKLSLTGGQTRTRGALAFKARLRAAVQSL